MRNVIRLFDDGNNGAFERVFKTDDGNPLPLAIFARAASAELPTYGGKQQTLALILNDIPVSYDASLVHYDHPKFKAKFKNLLDGFNAECLEETGEFISGIEQSGMEEEPVDKDEDNDGEEDISYIPSAGQPGSQTN